MSCVGQRQQLAGVCRPVPPSPPCASSSASSAASVLRRRAQSLPGPAGAPARSPGTGRAWPAPRIDWSSVFAGSRASAPLLQLPADDIDERVDSSGQRVELAVLGLQIGERRGGVEVPVPGLLVRVDLLAECVQLRVDQDERIQDRVVQLDRDPRRKPEHELELVERGLQVASAWATLARACWNCLERLVHLDDRDLPAAEQLLVLPQVLLLADQVRLGVPDRLHLQQQRQVAAVESRDAGPELLAETVEVAGGVQDVAARPG